MKLSKADLETLLKKGDTDYVAQFTSPQIQDIQLAQTLVAMANCSGGTLIVNSVKQSEIDKLQRDIVDIALSLTPRLFISMPYIIELGNKPYLIVQIPQGLPNVYAHNGHYLQRNNTENEPLAPSQLRRLMLARGEHSYESEIAYDSTIEDINWQDAEQYTKRLTGMSQYSVKEILFQRGCLAQHQDDFVPTNAGILLFGKSPKQYSLSSEVTAVRFAGDKMGDTFNRQDISGTLPEQIRRTETFLADNLRKSVTLKQSMKRDEDYEYPMEAVRELIVNAVAHRDYSIQGDNIRLHIYSNHLEVHSPGSLPGPMTLDNIKDERFSRNPIIVQVLSDMGFIERLGYGVDRVIELMESKGFQTPKFTNTPSGFKVNLTKPLNTKKHQSTEQKTKLTKPQSVVSFHGVFKGQKINPRQESALIYLHKDKNSRITNSDLKGMFPDVHPETIRRDLVNLVNKNILQKRGQKRGSYYVLATDEFDDD